MQPATDVRSAADVLRAYKDGRRNFSYAELPGADFAGADLRAASFLRANLADADFEAADLTYVQLKGANATRARFVDAWLTATDVISTDFTDANLTNVDFTGAAMSYANLTRAVLSKAFFNSCRLHAATLDGAKMSKLRLNADLSDLDVGPFCDVANLVHTGPSTIDARTVMKSLGHPKLKQFMLDCGVPEVFAEYMIDCARATDNVLLRSLMDSTFISYGTPDESFARRLYDALRAHKVITYFFPETAEVGARINNEVFRKLQEHDRVLLICSRHSLDRQGVVNEIQETLDREARHGGATFLLPIKLDDYVVTGWKQTQPELSERLARRVIADFRGVQRSKAKFDAALARLLDVLKKKRP